MPSISRESAFGFPAIARSDSMSRKFKKSVWSWTGLNAEFRLGGCWSFGTSSLSVSLVRVRLGGVLASAYGTVSLFIGLSGFLTVGWNFWSPTGEIAPKPAGISGISISIEILSLAGYPSLFCLAASRCSLSCATSSALLFSILLLRSSTLSPYLFLAPSTLPTSFASNSPSRPSL